MGTWESEKGMNFMVTWEYKKTNNPQRCYCTTQRKAKSVEPFVLKSCPELEPWNFQIYQIGKGK